MGLFCLIGAMTFFPDDKKMLFHLMYPPYNTLNIHFLPKLTFIVLKKGYNK